MATSYGLLIKHSWFFQCKHPLPQSVCVIVKLKQDGYTPFGYWSKYLWYSM